MRAALLALLLLAGCAGQDWSRNVYEGVRQRQEALADPADKPAPSLPEYDHYRRETAENRP